MVLAVHLCKSSLFIKVLPKICISLKANLCVRKTFVAFVYLNTDNLVLVVVAYKLQDTHPHSIQHASYIFTMHYGAAVK